MANNSIIFFNSMRSAYFYVSDELSPQPPCGQNIRFLRYVLTHWAIPEIATFMSLLLLSFVFNGNLENDLVFRRTKLTKIKADEKFRLAKL